MPIPTYKVAIVGAGVSGLYTAWRLCVDTKTYDPKDVVVLEASDRTGGRLRTWTLNKFDPSLPDDPLVRAELGGMRILNYNLYAYSLSLELGLNLVPFPADVNENWHYLRGQVMQTQDYPEQQAYPLAPQEAGWTPGDVIYDALVTNGGIVPADQFPTEDGSITQRDFVNWVAINTSYRNLKSYETGFWNVLVGSGAFEQPEKSNVSYQAYAYFMEAGAYDTIPSNWNASVAFSNALGDFSNNPTYWAIDTGYESLTDKLRDQLTAAGVSIRLNTPVNAVTNAITTDNYVLTLGGAGQIAATHLVLALPPRALEILSHGASLTGNVLSGLRPQIAQSTPVPLFKIFLVYDHDWWSDHLGKDPHGKPYTWPAFTRMTTDMPMRQIYFFGQTKPDASGKTYYLFQAAYNDGLKAGYWAGLMPPEGQQRDMDLNTDIFGRVQQADGDDSIATGTLRFGTKDDVTTLPLFQTVHQQFATLMGAVAERTGTAHGLKPTLPIAGACMNWATDPFGGGVNFWDVGVELIDEANIGGAYWDMLSPMPNLYVVGEGYSLYQGWVEGALWSAEDMLGTYFSLATPSWLKGTPYEAPGAHVPRVAAGAYD